MCNPHHLTQFEYIIASLIVFYFHSIVLGNIIYCLHLTFVAHHSYCILSPPNPHYLIVFYPTQPPIWQGLAGWQWLTQAPPLFIPPPKKRTGKKETLRVPLCVYPLDWTYPLLPPPLISPPPQEADREIKWHSAFPFPSTPWIGRIEDCPSSLANPKKGGLLVPCR